MPELPEVEVTRLGLLRKLKNKKCTGAVVRETRFRKPLRADLEELLFNQTLHDIKRRGKYLIWLFDRSGLVTHLGMSGSMRVYLQADVEVQKHDHLDLIFGDMIMRYHDPRRFGFVAYFPDKESAFAMPELQRLGVEPLSEGFNSNFFYEALRQTSLPIKTSLIRGDIVVGVGNIYCSESLFLAGVHPKTKSNRISKKRVSALTDAVKEVLLSSIELGGSTLRDFVSAEGQSGYYTLNNNVYGREGQPCKKCGTLIKKVQIDGRSTFYCPHCQH